jgi:gamma-glutamyl-gamma-aminobutyraldehyde dehydrogenase
LARLRDWKTGDPLNPAHHLGALIDAEHCAKVASYLTGSRIGWWHGRGALCAANSLRDQPKRCQSR